MTNVDLNKLPPLYREILENFTIPLNPDVDLANMLNVLNAKMAHMVTSKRIMMRPIPDERPSIVNYYALNFISSGGGKDKLVRDINNYLLEKFEEYFKEKTAPSNEGKQAENEQMKSDKEKSKKKEKNDVTDKF